METLIDLKQQHIKQLIGSKIGFIQKINKGLKRYKEGRSETNPETFLQQQRQNIGIKQRGISKPRINRSQIITDPTRNHNNTNNPKKTEYCM